MLDSSRVRDTLAAESSIHDTLGSDFVNGYGGDRSGWAQVAYSDFGFFAPTKKFLKLVAKLTYTPVYWV